MLVGGVKWQRVRFRAEVTGAHIARRTRGIKEGG